MVQGLKLAGAEARTPVATHPNQKNVKGALAAMSTTEHAEEKKIEDPESVFKSFFGYNELEGGHQRRGDFPPPY